LNPLDDYIPLSKSVGHRLMILEMLDDGYEYMDFLSEQNRLNLLPDDLKVDLHILRDWKNRKIISVGESRTSLIFSKTFFNFKKLDRQFKKSGTLINRKLDGNSSQWKSARMLCGESIKPDSYHTKMTAKIIKAWNKSKDKTKLFNTKDDTIRNQCLMVEAKLKHKEFDFPVMNPEDAIIGFLFGYIGLADIMIRFPTLLNHESNRPKEIMKTMIEVMSGESITSKDHRIVTAFVMYGLVYDIGIKVKNPKCVTKAFVLFWRYYNERLKIIKYGLFK
jgi:hypothetical protein